MCNINILLKTKKYCDTKEELDNVVAFLQSATALSYSSNKDGDGIFVSSGKIARSNQKVNILPLTKDIGKSEYIISHQRLSTSGLAEDIHPFVFGDFVMVHNGIISQYAKGEHSDSYNLFKEFNEHFLESINSEGSTREKSIVSAIKKQFDEIGYYGTYSIAIFDRVEKVMYYFKNSGRYITLYETEGCLYMTTNVGNAEFLSLLKGTFVTKEVDAHKIYKFVVSENITYNVVGEIEHKTNLKASNVSYSGYGLFEDDWRLSTRTCPSSNAFSNRSLDWERGDYAKKGDDETIDDKFSEDIPKKDIYRGMEYDEQYMDYRDKYFEKCSKHKKCSFCKNVTRFITKKSRRRVCEDCIIEQMLYDYDGTQV